MKWTKRKPRKPGWYWHRPAMTRLVRIPELDAVYHVFRGKDESLMVAGVFGPTPLRQWVGQWSDKPLPHLSE